MTDLVDRIISWFEANQRDFPWRDPECSPWGVLVSEVMSQQTQMSRVEPKWCEFMALWPTPEAMASAPVAEVIRRWDRLGYPRRAVNLHRCAVAIVAEHGGVVPRDRAALLALPGIGAYTSAAVASFAYGQREPVVDTNVRRVIARTVHGEAVAWPANANRDEREMLDLLPQDPERAKLWNAGSMELGAVVCQAKKPLCEACPVREQCAWRARDYPPATNAARKQAKFEGSDRQLRGEIMAVLRANPAGAQTERLPHLLGRVDAEQSPRILALAATLVADGLAEAVADRIHLPR